MITHYLQCVIITNVHYVLMSVALSQSPKPGVRMPFQIVPKDFMSFSAHVKNYTAMLVHVFSYSFCRWNDRPGPRFLAC